MKSVGISILLLAFATGLYAQNFTVQQYIDTYKDIAITEMKRSGVPASITLAQGILESESGNSDLVLRSNNHFGIKCKSNWTGGSVYHDDDEQGECFRKYGSSLESFKDHSDFLKNSSRYARLFELDIKDYKGWAYGLKKCGYATNPRYPEILIKSIEKYQLQQYTIQGMSGDDIFDDGKFENEDNQPVTLSMSPVETAQQASPAVVLNERTEFNKLKAIYAAKGTSLLLIATENDIALSKLLEYNDLENDGLLQNDQWIYLERKHKDSEKGVHVVSKSESLQNISQLYAIQLEYLQEYNELKGNPVLSSGSAVRLKPGAALPEKQSAIVHQVMPKEGLYAISKKYNVSIHTIKELNQLTTDELKVGQQLIISK